VIQHYCRLQALASHEYALQQPGAQMWTHARHLGQSIYSSIYCIQYKPPNPFPCQTDLSRSEGPSSRCLPFLCSYLRLGPVEYLEELGDSVPHPRVHVGLGAFNVIV
jgi:hypothetical protein